MPAEQFIQQAFFNAIHNLGFRSPAASKSTWVYVHERDIIRIAVCAYRLSIAALASIHTAA